jgi:hypothetical protein
MRRDGGRREQGKTSADRKPMLYDPLRDIQRRSRKRSRWVAAAIVCLIRSTFSTVLSQLFAPRIGRDAVVD